MVAVWGENCAVNVALPRYTPSTPFALSLSKGFAGALACATVLVFGCATAESPGGNQGGGPDAGDPITPRPDARTGSDSDPDAPPGEEPDARVIVPVDAPPDPIDARPPPDAAPQPVAITITHSTDPNTVLAQNSILCPGNDTTGDGLIDFHRENHYVRVFNLEDFGITSGLTIDSVEFGIEIAQSPAGEQPVQLRFSTLAGSLTFANMDRIGTFNLDVNDGTQVLLTANLDTKVEVPAGETLVVEIFTADGSADSNLFVIGSNNGGESDPSFIAAPGDANCGINDPTPITSLRDPDGNPFPPIHIVMSVNGTHVP